MTNDRPAASGASWASACEAARETVREAAAQHRRGAHLAAACERAAHVLAGAAGPAPGSYLRTTVPTGRSVVREVWGMSAGAVSAVGETRAAALAALAEALQLECSRRAAEHEIAARALERALDRAAREAEER